MTTKDLPDFLRRRVVEHEDALAATVRSGTRIGSGLATSEPVRFYADLWRHVVDNDLHGLTIRQGLFLAPHPLLVGDDLAAELDDVPDRRDRSRLRRFVEHAAERFEDTPAESLADQVVETATEFAQLRLLVAHLEELRSRDITFVSGFLGPVTNTVIPDLAPIRALYPDWAGRNRARGGIVRFQPVHFPDAADALVVDPHTGEQRIDLFVLPVTAPRDGRVSYGLSNGANGDAMVHALDGDADILLYMNARYPFVRGLPGAPNTIELEALRGPAEEGRLWIVDDDTAPPGLPPGSFDDPSEEERRIGELVAEHITSHLDVTAGRALQLGIGGTGVQAITRLTGSDWTGRCYTEMLEPYTFGLLEAGNVTGSHWLDDEGLRHDVDDAIVCTFAIAEEDSDFYEHLDGSDAVRMASATRVLQQEAFYGGLGINNVLGIDFQGHVNVSGRDRNPYSGIGGAGIIHRGLARGGIAYLCLKSTHRTADGERRSSVFPYLPEGTPVSLTGPDLMGTRDGARFYLVTEHGIAPINSRDQHEFIASLVSVAHPDFRNDLARAAHDEFRVHI